MTPNQYSSGKKSPSKYARVDLLHQSCTSTDAYNSLLGYHCLTSAWQIPTREKGGIDRTVSREAQLSVYFAGFLRDATNKEELLNLLIQDEVKRDYPPN